MKQTKKVMSLLLAILFIIGCAIPVSAKEELAEKEEEYVVNSKGIKVKKSLLCDDPDCLEKHVGNTLDVADLPMNESVEFMENDDRMAELKLMKDVYVGMVAKGNDARVAFWGTPGTAGVHEFAIYDGALAGVKGNAWCINHGAANPGEGFWQTCTYTAECKSIQGNQAEWHITIVPPGAWDGESYNNGLPAGYQRLGARVTVPFEEPKGNLELYKSAKNEALVLGNSNYSLQGAEYGLFQNGVEKGRVVTDEKGFARFENYEKGSYILKEVKAPKGYALDTKEYPVTLGSGQSTRMDVKDAPQYTAVRTLLQKVDQETGEPKAQGNASLEGAEFTVKYYSEQMETDPQKDGKEPLRSWVMKTDETGSICMDEEHKVSGDEFYFVEENAVLPIGTVTIQETKAPEGYLLHEEVYVYPVVPNGIEEQLGVYQEQLVPEQVMRGDVELQKYKTSEDEEYTCLEGVRFTFTSKTTGQLVAEIVTDKKGWGTTYDSKSGKGKLPYDTYVVEEDRSTVPEGLESIEPFEVASSKENQILRYEVENKEIVAPVKLVKIDCTTGKVIPLANAEFQLLDHEKNVVTLKAGKILKRPQKIFKTDSTGTLLLPKRIPYGTYYFREIQAPEGYVRSKEDVCFEVNQTLKWENPMTVTFENEPALGKIKLEKIDKETKQSVSGEAQFQITAKEDIITPDGTVRAKAGDVVDTITTDGTGLAESKELFLGNYVIREKKAPNGYLVSEEEIEICLEYQDQDTGLVIEKKEVENDFTKIDLGKFDVSTKKELEGGIYQVLDKNEIVLEEWTGTRTPHRMERLTSDETYIFREVHAPEGYLLAEDVRFSVKKTTEVQAIAMYDEVEKGRIEIVKQDAESGQYLTGVKFQIYAAEDIVTPDGTCRIKKGTLIEEVETKEGYAKSKSLYLGTYEVVESQVLPGYVQDETRHTITLKYKDQNTALITEQIKIKNHPTKVVLEKRIKGTDEPLEGVTFQMWASDKKEEQKSSKVTDANGRIVWEYLQPGEYCIQEISTVPGYVLEDTIHEFRIDKNGKVLMDGEKESVEEGLLFLENDDTKVTISKQDAETGKELSGAELKLIRKDTKEVVKKWTSQEEPYVIHELEPGTYILREVQAPKGYKLASDVVFTVEETGDMQTVVMQDEKFGKMIRPKDPRTPGKNTRIPKTGDSLSLTMLLIVSVGSVIILCFGLGHWLFSFRKKCSILINKHRLKKRRREEP